MGLGARPRFLTSLGRRFPQSKSLPVGTGNLGFCPIRSPFRPPGEEPRTTIIGWANASDTPFRKFKADTYEGGIATPFIAHWPKGITAKGELRHQPAHVIDLMPTLLELAGVAYPAEFRGQLLLPLEGRSLVPVFQNERLLRGALFHEHEGNKAVRQGDWKRITP
jgi:arylsulfatase A-like enzyme